MKKGMKRMEWIRNRIINKRKEGKGERERKRKRREKENKRSLRGVIESGGIK